MPCKGSDVDSCGDAWFLSVYTFNATGLPSCAPATTTAVKPTTATSISVAPAPTTTSVTYTNEADESVWRPLGCAVDSYSRVLSEYSMLNVQDMTVDKCLSACESRSYTYAGLEYGEECHCGNSVAKKTKFSQGSCGMGCTGDQSKTCGGDWGLDVYQLLLAGKTSTTSKAGPPASASSLSSSTTSSSSTAAATSTTVPSSNNPFVAPSPTDAPASSESHSVWAHHMVGNTYPYGVQDWSTDIQKAVSYGIDGFALNMGSDWWQPNRIQDAYTAARASGSGFKMFLSLDMTVMSCGSWADGVTLVNLVKRWANHPNQAMHNGKVLVSTFAGSDCTFGMGSNSGWQSAFVDALKSQGISIFFVPSVFSDPSTFQSNTWMDGELNWNSAWPMGSGDMNTDTDWNYINQLGSKEYMAAISPFFYTHFGANSWNKNWLYRSDDWLYASRWEALIAMRDRVKSLEILTWNDYGESSYIGPIHGALPAGSEAWTYGFDHEGINVLTKYYSAAFKTGVYPTITKDQIVMWQRPHPRAATASNDGAGRPTGWDWTDDTLYAIVFTTGAADVTLTSGSNSKTFSVSGGLTKLKIDADFGGISGKILRSGNQVASYASAGFSYTATPSTYNFNYYLGSSS